MPFEEHMAQVIFATAHSQADSVTEVYEHNDATAHKQDVTVTVVYEHNDNPNKRLKIYEGDEVVFDTEHFTVPALQWDRIPSYMHMLYRPHPICPARQFDIENRPDYEATVDALCERCYDALESFNAYFDAGLPWAEAAIYGTN
jgi:hypothetical protein